MAHWARSSCLLSPQDLAMLNSFVKKPRSVPPSHLRSAVRKTSFQNKAKSHSGKMVVKGSSQICRPTILYTRGGLRHMDTRTKLLYRDTEGGHRALVGASRQPGAGAQDRNRLPRSGGVSDGTLRVGFSSGLREHRQPVRAWTRVTLCQQIS